MTSDKILSIAKKEVGTRESTCICCGSVIPEGRMVCPNCEAEVN